MKALKKIVALSFVVVFVFGFLFSITEVPNASAAGGSYCDSGDSFYCWTSIPYWQCSLVPGGDDCVGEF